MNGSEDRATGIQRPRRLPDGVVVITLDLDEPPPHPPPRVGVLEGCRGLYAYTFLYAYFLSVYSIVLCGIRMSLDFTKLVRRVYETIAVSYGYLRRRLWAPVGIIVEDKGIYLDGGCGPGQYSVYLANRFNVEVVCIDIAYNMVDLTYKRARNKGVDLLVHCVQGDLLKLPFRNNSFNGGFYIASLHHIPGFKGRLRCLIEFLRVVKKNSRIFITVWSLVQPRFMDYIVKWAVWRLRGIKLDFGDNLVPWRHRGKILWRYYHLFTLPELKRLLSIIKDVKCIFGSIRVYSKVFPENYYSACVVNKQT